MAIYKKAEELWITNISRVQDIRLADLAITVRRGQSLNLLSKKKNGLPRFPCTKEMIEKSRKDGSIFKKGHVIKVREVAPVVFNSQMEIAGSLDRGATRLKRKRTEIEIPEYPDLDLNETSLEDYAAENADMDFADRAPALPVDPLYKKPTVDDE